MKNEMRSQANHNKQVDRKSKGCMTPGDRKPNRRTSQLRGHVNSVLLVVRRRRVERQLPDLRQRPQISLQISAQISAQVAAAERLQLGLLQQRVQRLCGFQLPPAAQPRRTAPRVPGSLQKFWGQLGSFLGFAGLAVAEPEVGLAERTREVERVLSWMRPRPSHAGRGASRAAC
jgi:hypothetical protein